jgi:hypothetical protein
MSKQDAYGCEVMGVRVDLLCVAKMVVTLLDDDFDEVVYRSWQNVICDLIRMSAERAEADDDGAREALYFRCLPRDKQERLGDQIGFMFKEYEVLLRRTRQTLRASMMPKASGGGETPPVIPGPAAVPSV